MRPVLAQHNSTDGSASWSGPQSLFRLNCFFFVRISLLAVSSKKENELGGRLRVPNLAARSWTNSLSSAQKETIIE